ncbi:MAG: TerB family tellurite resistance protein [Nitrospirae bacterium]|nr:TerB family tellurite resistance protein [Nitrospirota bacterium]
MISTVKQFFEKYVKSASGSTDNVSDHSLMIATAALLIEMMRADAQISEDEHRMITNTIQSKFELTVEETGALLQLAEEKIWKSTGYFEFTSLMNKGFSYSNKLKVIEHLWEIAFADAVLDKHEEYMVRKIADLIYVSHNDFIEAKLRVKKKLL